jgi:CRISPR-associated protein Csm1
MKKLPDNIPREIFYGALLHDIGKLFFKAGRENNHIEAGLKAATNLFAGQELPQIIRDSILYHHAKDLKRHAHEVSPETWLIYEADNIAAGLDRRNDSEISAESSAPATFDKALTLTSSFSLLNNGLGAFQDDHPDSYHWSYPLRMLGKEDEESREPLIVYPQDKTSDYFKASKDRYEIIAKKWDEEISANQDVLCENPNALLVLMEALLSYSPSDTFTGRIPDISLYEHLRITTAIATCMYLRAVEDVVDFKTRGEWENEEQKNEHRNLQQFLLVGGDLSGIQKFIYNITGKGALKGLRARSFYLELLTEHVIDEILEQCGGLTRANIIFSGGGHFYLLLPNSQIAINSLSVIQKRLNTWLWQEFRGGLSASIAFECCSALDLMDPKDADTGKRQGRMRQKWQHLSDKLAKLKSRKFSMLDEADFSQIFQPGETAKSSEECAITHADHDLILYELEPDQEKVWCNRIAASLHHLGKDLPKANYIWIQRNCQPEEGECKKEGVILPDLINPGRICKLYVIQSSKPETGEVSPGEVSPKDEERIRNQSGKLYSINRWVLGKYLHTNLMVGQYFPRNEMPDFSSLATVSRGNQKIGVLRADVDDLGTLFTEKLPESCHTFSRVAMLAKHLSMFFKLYINRICAGDLRLNSHEPFQISEGNGNHERDVVIVYSGGDDLFIVGAWDQVLELAVDIRRCFERYTCAKLTLSMGVQVFDPHVPIAHMAHLTGEAEQKAKSYMDEAKGVKKDALCLFPNPAALEFDAKNLLIRRERQHRDVYPWQNLLLQEKQGSLLWLVRTLYTMTPENGQQDSWFNSSVLHRLYQLALTWSDEGYVALPRLAYLLARLEQRLKDHKDSSEGERFKQIKQFLYQSTWLDVEEKEFQKVGIQDFKTVFTWISYLSREVKQ